MTRITLINTQDDDAQMYNKGARLDTITKKWTIDESQKSDTKFAKYLPIDPFDKPPSDDWAPATEKQIKTYPEPVIAESSRDLSAPEKPTKKRKPRKTLKLADKAMTETRTFQMKPDRINDLKDLSRYFQLNLSMTIDKAIDFLLKHVQDQNKSDLSKLYKDTNSLLPRLANEISKLQNQIKVQHDFIDFIARREIKNNGAGENFQNRYKEFLTEWTEAQNVSNDER